MRSRLLENGWRTSPLDLSTLNGRARQKTLAFITFAGLPLFLITIYANLSDLAIRNLATPSLVQPLIAILALAVWYDRAATVPSEIFRQPLTILLAVWVFALFLGSNWANDASLADARLEEAAKCLAIFAVAACLTHSWRALRGAFISLTVAAAGLAALTVLQTATGSDNELGGLASLTVASIYGNVFERRASGPVGDPNFYAQLLLIVVPLAALLTMTARRWSSRLASGAAIFAIIAGIVLTYSRGAMVGLAAMALAAALVLRVPLRHLAAAAIAGLLLVAVVPSDLTRRLGTMEELFPRNDTISEGDASIEKRKLLLAAGWEMFSEHPLLGVGAGNFSRYFSQYANQVGTSAPQYEEPGQTEYPHTLYLEIASENGLLGLTIFAAMIAAAFVSLRSSYGRLDASRRREQLTVIAIGVSLFGYLTTSLFLHGGYQRHLWIVLALVAAADRLARRNAEPLHDSI